MGIPYEPRVSIGQIVGWQLEKVFPDRRITVDVRARGGSTLGQAMRLLSDMKRQPDAIIVFSGHNEFLTRFGWSRAVRHYVEEGPESPLAWLELARAASATTNLILNALDRQYGEAPPPSHVARELIDHPICTPKEYESNREDFRRYLDALAAYCERIGAVPILIVPGSNDGAFAPNRSVLAAGTPPAARAEFERAFRSARSLEATDPAGATAAFRRLVDQHPEFAEGHYRLARRLGASSAWEEARPHFLAARDFDAAAVRCPSDFREAIKAVGRRHDALVIDCETLFAPLSPRGVLDDHIYHDAHHPNLVGMVVLAQDILEQLHRRRAWGWHESNARPSDRPGRVRPTLRDRPRVPGHRVRALRGLASQGGPDLPRAGRARRGRGPLRRIGPRDRRRPPPAAREPPELETGPLGHGRFEFAGAVTRRRIALARASRDFKKPAGSTISATWCRSIGSPSVSAK